jgi:hypothetical protein
MYRELKIGSLYKIITFTLVLDLLIVINDINDIQYFDLNVCTI